VNHIKPGSVGQENLRQLFYCAVFQNLKAPLPGGLGGEPHQARFGQENLQQVLYCTVFQNLKAPLPGGLGGE